MIKSSLVAALALGILSSTGALAAKLPIPPIPACLPKCKPLPIPPTRPGPIHLQ